jgi:DNA-binding NtrC family response regulator
MKEFMKRILYLDPKSRGGRTDEVLRNRGHKLVAARRYVDALEILRSQSFDAVVIDDEDENPEVLDFTVQAHCLRPELPVFLTVDWGVELPMALESLGKVGEFGDLRPGELSFFNGFPASRHL